MIENFKDDFFWMLRQSKGYFPWIDDDNYRLQRLFYRSHYKMCPECFHDFNTIDLIKILLNEVVCENEMIDLFFKALIRAEIRFISRFIPQRSNEERLTGNLVSEIDSSIFLIKDQFQSLSLKSYSEKKTIDFYYYDLSKGGKVEKETGADLGFILVIDLPDHPFTVKSFIFQAKKINNKVQIDKEQYLKLKKIDDQCCGYLFYDMNFSTLSSPLVLKLDDYNFTQKMEKSYKKNTKSFYLDFNEILHGVPLSIFIIKEMLIKPTYGKQHLSFKNALNFFKDLCNENKLNNQFNGRVGIVSLGSKINYDIKNDEVFNITI